MTLNLQERWERGPTDVTQPGNPLKGREGPTVAGPTLAGPLAVVQTKAHLIPISPEAPDKNLAENGREGRAADLPYSTHSHMFIGKQVLFIMVIDDVIIIILIIFIIFVSIIRYIIILIILIIVIISSIILLITTIIIILIPTPTNSSHHH